MKVTTALCLTVLLSAPAFAEAKKVKWKLAMTWPSTLSPFASPSIRVAKLVEEMSGGNFTIKVHDKEKHKAALSILDMVKNKQYQMGHSSAYYYKGKSISTAILTTVPFGMTSTEQYSWYYYGGGEALTKKVFDKFKVDCYPGGNTGVQMGGWFKKEIKTLADLKGLKMRIPGMAGEVFSKLGVNVTNIPAGELYTSLDRGTIDALEWVGPGMDIKMGFHKVAPFYYTGWHEPATELHFFVNQKAFAKLPAEYQTILTTAMKAVTADMMYENFDMSQAAWAKMQKDFPNIKVKTFSKPILKAMKKATDETMDAYAKKDALFNEVYTSRKDYLKKARDWTEISEFDYVKTSQMVE
ncbi:MAG: TRAP transporter solute receptor, unknown substrate 6 [uncultured Sulfurovum sp.]|uniref:ABC transporter substrate-binding protein n=1 Tax=uncultured Sulfurovum sp. TaxID=269237 RepID=A0A6S6TNF0_9BACT|nr:MAG: TRAP transporter solute receptor, unknown substrate 6 [uncultured Sulfurovum sp.]